MVTIYHTTGNYNVTFTGRAVERTWRRYRTFVSVLFGIGQ